LPNPIRGKITGVLTISQEKRSSFVQRDEHPQSKRGHSLASAGNPAPGLKLGQKSSRFTHLKYFVEVQDNEQLSLRNSLAREHHKLSIVCRVCSQENPGHAVLRSNAFVL